MINSDIAIKLINVSKKYEIHHEKPTLVEKFTKGKNETFWALKNINLTITKGERIGIMGSNGSGKTTLLKLISKITAPTSGFVFTNGKVVSLIDLGAGFHPDLTGYQNIYLNGILIGLSKQTIIKIIPKIISFAGIRQFIDVPLYTYSDGMKLRLGFSIAIYSEPDILIMDENISVGDAAFQKKTMDKIQNIYSKKRTVIMTNHWEKFLKQNCSRILMMDHGSILPYYKKP